MNGAVFVGGCIQYRQYNLAETTPSRLGFSGKWQFAAALKKSFLISQVSAYALVLMQPSYGDLLSIAAPDSFPTRRGKKDRQPFT